MRIPVLLSSFRDYCFYPRKHRLAQPASILARNVVIVLLMMFRHQNGHFDNNSGMLLTVAGQPVICTRFLFKSGVCTLLTLLCKEK